jgi:hypothetical protein
MVHEEIIGGLISALSRGEPLQKAMMTFYNAGYGKQEIEEAARLVYSQVGADVAKTGYLSEAIKAIASKVGLVKKNTLTKVPVTPPAQPIKPVPEPVQKPVQKPIQEKKPEKENINKNINPSPQKVSIYGDGKQYREADQITHDIERAIKDLSQIKFPSKIEIINRNMDEKSSIVLQKISNYSDGPSKPGGRIITYLLVFILILLLGVLAVVFFFKDDLVKIFNSLGFG